MKALILAAGYATRLYPLTKEYPKPLLKVGGRPIIEYILEKLIPLETLDEVIVVTNSKFAGKFRQWKARLSYPTAISIVDDLTATKEKRRGAIGDMHFVIKKKRITDDLMVIGGDNIFDGDLRTLLACARRHRLSPVIGVYKLARRQEAREFGVIKLDRQCRVVDFKEKPRNPASSLIAMCLYYFPRSKIGLVGEYMRTKKNKHDASGFYIDWLRGRETVYGCVFEGSWFDIGRHKTFRQAQEHFVQSQR